MRAPQKSLANAFNPKKNAFDFVRFALATLVIFSHSYPLGGFGADPLESYSRIQESLGGLAVLAFFAMSGFLITRSATGPISVTRFMWHRFLRIMPGFWVCLCVTAFVIGPVIWLVEGNQLSRYFQWAENNPFRYVLANLGLWIQQTSIYQLPTQTPGPNEINGSLWTLSHEFVCYLSIAFLIATGLLKKSPWMVLVIAAALIGFEIGRFVWPDLPAILAPPYSTRALFLQHATCFFVGASLFLYAKYVPDSFWLFVLCIGVFIASFPLGFYPLIYGITLPYIFIWLALKLPLTEWGQRGDFSYGIYVYGFPIQQTLAALKLNQSSLLFYFALAFAITLLFAGLSHHLVEAPALRLKSIYPGAFKRHTSGVGQA